jgi:hypothetical protein
MIQTFVLPGIRETCENVEAHGFNNSGPDLRLDSTFAANGQEDPHRKDGQNGYDTYK